MNLKRALNLIILVAGFISAPLLTYAVTINFDDLPTQGASSGVLPLPPEMYAGFEWSGAWRYITPNDFAPTYLTGYPGSATSLPNALWSAWSGILSIYSSSPFDLASAKVKAALRDNLQLNVKGYLEGVLKYDKNYILNATAPIQIDFNYTTIDRVDFSSSGGTKHAGYSFDGPDFVMDDINYSINNCVKLSGNGSRKVVFMRGNLDLTNTKSVSGFMTYTQNAIDYGFKRIDPFKTYIDQFSFYVDLKKVDTGKFAMWNGFYPDAADDIIKKGSSCGSDAMEYVLFADDPEGYYAYVNGRQNANVVYLNNNGLQAPTSASSFITSNSDYQAKIDSDNLKRTVPNTVIHESGHAIGQLYDSYDYGDFRLSNFPTIGGNCVVNPNVSFRSSINGLLYGAIKEQGCVQFGTSEGAIYFKPSHSSIMGNLDPANPTYREKFDVVSCGYLMAAIKGEPVDKAHAEKYWPECLNLDTVTEGIPPIVPAPVIYNITSAAPGRIATVKGAGFTPTGNRAYFLSPVDGSSFEVREIPSADGSTITFTVPANLPVLPASSVGYSFKAAALNSFWSNQLNFSTSNLPNLGMYRDKFSKLQKSILVAIDSLKKKQTAALANVKAGEIQKGNPQIDVPLQLLTRMKRNLETDANGSLKDHTGFARFFTYLKSLDGYTDVALAEVFLRANELAGFSYLFPPSGDKPILISVPGAGGEGGWRGSFELLKEKSADFNIVVYTYDPASLTAREMTDLFISKFLSSKLNAINSVIVSLSMGSTVLHSAILRDVSQGSTNFSNSYVVSAGLLPGGAAEFLGWMKVFVPIAPYAYPLSRGVIDVMNPANPIYTDIANNMAQIASKTKGISYIQATADHHTDSSASGNSYASNRDKTFAGMMDRVDVIPPSKYLNNKNQIEKNNDHINLLYATEVKSKIDYYLGLLNNPPTLNYKIRSVAQVQFLAPDWLNKTIERIGEYFRIDQYIKTASAQTSLPGDPNFVPDFFGGPDQELCAEASDILEDALVIPEMDYDLYASKLGEYMALTEAVCSIEDESEEAFSDLEILPVSESVPLSGAESYELDLDPAVISSLDLMVDGVKVNTDTFSPWILSFDSTQFSNGIHNISLVINQSPTVSFATKSVPVTINNSSTSYSLLITNSGTGTGTVTCSNAPCPTSLAKGAQITLTAHPSSGFVFSGWSVTPSNTLICQSRSPCTITMDSNKTVSASFITVENDTGGEPLPNPSPEPPPIVKNPPAFIAGSYQALYESGTTNQKITMSWSYPSPRSMSVSIERSDSSQTAFRQIAEIDLISGANSGSYEDHTVGPTRAYTYRLRSVYSDGTYSDYSPSISVMTRPYPIGVPTLSAVPASSNQINLLWTMPTTEGIKSYAILDKINNPPLVQNILSTASYYPMTGLMSDTRYCFILQPVAIYGTGFYGGALPSSSVCAKTLKTGVSLQEATLTGIKMYNSADLLENINRPSYVPVLRKGDTAVFEWTASNAPSVSIDLYNGDNTGPTTYNQNIYFLQSEEGAEIYQWAIPNTLPDGFFWVRFGTPGATLSNPPAPIKFRSFVGGPVVVIQGNPPPPPPAGENPPPGGGGSNETACDPTKELCNPIRYDSIPCFFKELLRIAAQIGSIFIILGFVYSGFLFVTARGNEEELGKAKRAITYTVIGAIIVLGAWAFAVGITNTINTIVNGNQTLELCP